MPTQRRSPFDFDISAAADKKRRSRGRGISGAVETSGRICEREGCSKPGKYRAPRSPDNLDEFHWFCLDHVREYNLKWNFFQSYSDADDGSATSTITWVGVPAGRCSSSWAMAGSAVSSPASR